MSGGAEGVYSVDICYVCLMSQHVTTRERVSWERFFTLPRLKMNQTPPKHEKCLLRLRNVDVDIASMKIDKNARKY
jgi:hypothetical protein